MARREWCPECRSRELVAEEFQEDTGDSRTRVETYWVVALECGHQNETQTGSTPSPLGPPQGLPRSYALGEQTREDHL